MEAEFMSGFIVGLATAGLVFLMIAATMKKDKQKEIKKEKK